MHQVVLPSLSKPNNNQLARELGRCSSEELLFHDRELGQESVRDRSGVNGPQTSEASVFMGEELNYIASLFYVLKHFKGI